MKKDLKNKLKKENTIKLKAKKILRDFMEKKMFYTMHSKFATYIEPDYLRIFETELISFTKSFSREFSKNMDPERNPGKEGHSNTRGLHSLDVALNSRDSGNKLLLNEDLLRVGGLIHDLGHLAFAHDGEKIISNYLKSIGMAEIHHPVMAWPVEMSEGIHERTIRRLEEERGKKFTEKELKKYNEYRFIIMDIAAAHNGEGIDYEIVADRDKTIEKMKEQFIKAFTEKGADRKIRSKSVEGTVVRFEDIISYVAKDFRGGVISGIIDVNDKDYEKIFIKMGIPKETLDEWAKGTEKKDKIVRAVTYILRDNLEQCSKGLNGARMSKHMADLMYELRDLNYHKVVGPRTRKIMDILPERIPELIDKYAKILLAHEKNGTKDEEINSFRTNMRRNIVKKQSKETIAAYREIVVKGIESFVRKEIDEVIDGSKPETVTNRRKRFETDIKTLKQKGKITEDVREAYAQRVLKEIYLSSEESEDMLRKRLRLQYPNTASEEFEKLIEQNRDLRLETFEECFAKFRVALYVGGSSNDYLLDMLEEEKLLTEEERALRFKYGGSQSNSSVGDTMKGQAEERAKMNNDGGRDD